MTTGKKELKFWRMGSLFRPKFQCDDSGQSLRVMRESFKELLEWTGQKLSGLPQSTISGMESGRINIGVERAKVLAKALRIHPAVIVFPRLGNREASWILKLSPESWSIFPTGRRSFIYWTPSFPAPISPNIAGTSSDSFGCSEWFISKINGITESNRSYLPKHREPTGSEPGSYLLL